MVRGLHRERNKIFSAKISDYGPLSSEDQRIRIEESADKLMSEKLRHEATDFAGTDKKEAQLM